MSGNERSSFPEQSQNGVAGPIRSFEWAAIITNRPELAAESSESARDALLNWWNRSAEAVSRKISGFPEPFQTTRFKKEIRFIERPLAALKPAFDSLRAGESSFFEAMDYLGRSFAWNQARLRRWKDGLESLSALDSWLPAFMKALEYLNVALPLGREGIDGSRDTLLRSIQEPCNFLGDSARRGFEEKFFEFKRSYIEAYIHLHEDALLIVGGSRRDEAKVDKAMLRNLDLLSSLPHMDKSYLNRVKLLARWVKRNECNLPVRQILERYPRCYCNFNPSGYQQPADSAAQINGFIRDGIDYFRGLLGRCGHLITAELKVQQVDEHARRPIAALLGDGPIVPLRPQTIKILNRIISKYPNEFLAEIRKK